MRSAMTQFSTYSTKFLATLCNQVTRFNDMPSTISEKAICLTAKDLEI